MPFVTYEFPDFSLLNQRIGHRIQQLQSLDTPLEQIRDDFYKTEAAWFDSEGGGQWQPLSPRYAAWKGRFFPGKPIMRRSDALYNAITGQPGEHTIRLGELHISVTGVPYWKWHQLGKGRLPVREVLSAQIQARVRAWHQMVTDWLTRKS